MNKLRYNLCIGVEQDAFRAICSGEQVSRDCKARAQQELRLEQHINAMWVFRADLRHLCCRRILGEPYALG